MAGIIPVFDLAVSKRVSFIIATMNKSEFLEDVLKSFSTWCNNND